MLSMAGMKNGTNDYFFCLFVVCLFVGFIFAMEDKLMKDNHWLASHLSGWMNTTDYIDLTATHRPNRNPSFVFGV